MSLVSGRKDGCGGGTSMMMGFMGRVAARLRCLDFDKCVGHFYFKYYMYLYTVYISMRFRCASCV